MARFSRVSFLFVHLLVSSILSGQPEKEIDWRYEIDLLGKELVRRHSDLFFQADSAAFFRELDRIASEAHGKDVFQVSVRLQQALARLGDPQTQINYHFNIENQFILPFECYWFEDGLYILKSTANHRELAGKKILSLNGFPLGQVIDSLSTLLVQGNPSLLKCALPRMITWTQLLNYFGFAETLQVELVVEDPQGVRTDRKITLPEGSGEPVSAYPETLPLNWQERKAYFRELYFPGEKIYYIQYNKCWSREAEVNLGTGARALFMPSFTKFEKRVFRTIKNQRVEKLVLDLRFNDGGDPSQGTRFIEKLGSSRVRENGKVYLVVGPKTSSSALVNAVDLIRRFDVVTVGEETGGKPNHFGNIERFVLPESKLVVNCATRYYRLLEEDPPSIVPDILTPETFTSFMEGIDPAFEAIRNDRAD